MRKFALILMAVLISQSGLAQLYVNNNFVFVADKYLYVKQDLNIQSTGNFYLRNESQLLQGKTGASANSGTGKLSVFQEGTVNNFAYNYWCSPVGNSIFMSGNGNFGITMLEQPTAITSSSPAIILGAGLWNGSANPLTIASGWIYKFLSSSQYSQWIAAGSSASIGPGEGYTMKGTSGTDATFSDAGVSNNPGSRQRYDFRGRPNDGDVSINVAVGQRTLTGNPYPSAIDLKAFLLGATNSTGIAYFWEQDKTVNSHYLTAYKGGYGVYSPIGGANLAGYGTMGIYTPAIFYAYDGAGTQLGAVGAGSNYERRFCPIGQGFMIEGASTGIVTMANVYRVYQKEGAARYSQFERSSHTETALRNRFLPAIPSVSGFDYTTVSTDPVPQIRFNTLLNNQAVRQVVLAFHPAATDGADYAMDAKSPDAADTDMYFVIDNAAYVIDVVDFDIHKKVPVGFKNTVAATFRIGVAQFVNFTGTAKVYLHDKNTDSYYNLLNGDYELALTAGINNTQYEITFLDETLDVTQWNDDSFEVLQNNITQTVTVMNSDLVPLESISLYDLSGKLIFGAEDLSIKAQYQFSTSTLSDALYIVKVVTKNHQDFGKKISVYNGH